MSSPLTEEPKSETPEEEATAPLVPSASDRSGTSNNEERLKGNEAAEEEEGECGFCLFMKGGDCREAFIALQNCWDEAEKNEENMVKYFEVHGKLMECANAHTDYYKPFLLAEKASEEKAKWQVKEEEEATQ